MKNIKELAGHIEDELEDAQEYALKAMECKDNAAASDTFIMLAQDEMKHAAKLHELVVAEIKAWKEKNGKAVPEKMIGRYEYMHDRYIEKAAAVKALIAMHELEDDSDGIDL